MSAAVIFEALRRTEPPADNVTDVTLSAERDDLGTIEGLAAVWGKVYPVAGLIDEVIVRGAVKVDAFTTALIAHNPAIVLGRAGAGTLDIRDTAQGLHFSVRLPDTGPGRDTRALVDRGDLVGASVGLRVEESTWELRYPHGNSRRLRERPLHIIRAGTLLEISVCARPVNKQAQLIRAENTEGLEAGDVIYRHIELEPGRKL